MEHKRGNWGSNFGFLMAAVGSAVGLGNLWGFPYKMGANGGFAFLIVYLLLVLFVGFVVMVGELALGRKSGLGVVGTYKKLSKEVRWLGWLGIASAFLIMSFYTVLGGYVTKYIVVNLGDIFGASWGSSGLAAGDLFNGLLTNQAESIIYSVIFLALTCLIVMGGISGGIEKFTKYAMPALFVMLLVVIIRDDLKQTSNLTLNQRVVWIPVFNFERIAKGQSIFLSQAFVQNNSTITLRYMAAFC